MPRPSVECVLDHGRSGYLLFSGLMDIRDRAVILETIAKVLGRECHCELVAPGEVVGGCVAPSIGPVARVG